MCHKSKGTINNNNNNNNSNNNIKLQNLEHLKLFTAKSSKKKKIGNYLQSICTYTHTQISINSVKTYF